MRFTSAFAFAALLTSATASLLPRSFYHAIPKGSGCPVEQNVLHLPYQDTLTLPTDGAKPTFITLGSGVQNYTCTPAGNYTSAGAVAKLYDISCLYGTPNFDQLTSIVHDRPKQATVSHSLARELRMIGISWGRAQFVSDHYFVPNPLGTGLSPKFEFHAPEPVKDRFVIGKRLSGIPAADPNDIDLLLLGNIAEGKAGGNLSKYVYRVSTKGGQPPKSCNPGESISVPYDAQYWFYS
jgi:hypothetical protein